MTRRALASLVATALLALALLIPAPASAKDKQVVKREEMRMELKLRSEDCYLPLADEIGRQPGVTKSRWDGKTFSVAFDPDVFSREKLMGLIRAFAQRCPIPAG